MGFSRRQQALLVVLAVVLVGAAYLWWPRSNASTGAGFTPRGGPASAATRAAPPMAPDVHLEELEAARPTPGAAERNLFSFAPKYVPPPIAPSAPPSEPVVPAGPPPPPQLPPIGLKFIGVIEAAGAAKIAILSDGKGAPIYGKEGDAVLGRYRILRIGSESLEMDYLDGRGRQIIRLSGS